MKTEESLEVLPYSKAGFGDERRFNSQIAITSSSGAGSSTLLRMIKEVWGQIDFSGNEIKYRSGGDFMRELAKLLDFPSIDSFVAHNKAHPEDGYDAICDKAQSRFALKNKCILESRLAHINAPYACKVLLVCDLEVRAVRMNTNRRESEFFGLSDSQIADSLRTRDQDDQERYVKLYPGCIWSKKDFDIVIDTGLNGKFAVLNELITRHRNWTQKLAPEHYITDTEMPSPHGVWMNL